MGKKGKKSTTNPKVSGGTRHQAKANRQICRLKMKIKRWDRYRTEGRSVSSACFANAKTANLHLSRLNDWNTAGLQKQLQLYEKIATSPAKRP